MFLHFSIVLVSVCLGVYIIECAPKVKEEEDPKQLVKRYHLECIEETRVDPDIITKIKNGDWRIPQLQLQLVKDWSLCVMMKAGLMTKQGVYRIDVALAKIPPEDQRRVEKLIDLCLSKKAIPAPEIAMNFVQCYQKAKDEEKYSEVTVL